MSSSPPVGCRNDLLQRVRGEFMDMTGLRLTCAQAQHLGGHQARTGAPSRGVSSTLHSRADPRSAPRRARRGPNPRLTARVKSGDVGPQVGRDVA